MTFETQLTALGDAKPVPVVEEVAVDDGYPNDFRRREIHERTLDMADRALRYLEKEGTPRQRRPELDLNNPGTAEFLHPDTSPGLRAWRMRHVPRAVALVPAYRPEADTLIGEQTLVLSTHEKDWFRHTADCVGIRTRSILMAKLMVDHGNARADRGVLRWASLACGAALPVLSAAKRLESSGLSVQVTMADHDSAALMLAEGFAAEIGVASTFKRANLLDPAGVRGLGKEEYDAVEILGLFEYLGDDDQIFDYDRVIHTQRAVAGAVSLLRNAWSLLRPGGLLVFGNMLPTHPQLDFTLFVVQWPHIRTRTPAEVANVVAKAGLPAGLRAVGAQDGVYAVYSLQKPL